MPDSKLISCCGLLCCLSLLVFAGCQNKYPVADGSDEKSSEPLEVIGEPPKAVVVDGDYNFGSMEVGQTLTHEFTIRNEGAGPLILVKDRSTCKCTMADFDRVEILPGEETSITLEWIGKNLDPTFSQAAYIKTNDPDAKEIELRVAGRVDQSFDITPSGAWNLGEMLKDKPTQFLGEITSRVEDEFEITGFETDSELIEVEFKPFSDEKLLNDGLKQGYEIVGEVKPGAPIGQFSEAVGINIETGDETKQAVFRVEGFYSGPMQIIGPAGWIASEMLLVMGRFPSDTGKEVNLSMFLRGNTGPPLEITKIKCDPEYINVELTKDEKFQAEDRERYNLKIEVPPGVPSLVYEKDNPASIEIETNCPIAPKMKFQVRLISY